MASIRYHMDESAIWGKNSDRKMSEAKLSAISTGFVQYSVILI